MIRRVIVYKCSDIKSYKRLGSVRKGNELEYFWRKLYAQGGNSVVQCKFSHN